MVDQEEEGVFSGARKAEVRGCGAEVPPDHQAPDPTDPEMALKICCIKLSLAARVIAMIGLVSHYPSYVIIY